MLEQVTLSRMFGPFAALRSVILLAAVISFAPPALATGPSLAAGRPVSGLTLSTQHINFGSAQMPDASPWQALVLKNNTQARVMLERVDVTEGFEARTDCLTELEPGYACSLELRFVPAGKTNDYHGRANVYTTDGRLYGVDLVGNQARVAAEVSVKEFKFGNLEVYGVEKSEPFTIRNVGEGQLILYGFSMAKPGPEFRVSPGSCAPFPKTLLPQESCSAALAISPEKAGDLENALNVTTNELRGGAHVPVHGSGTQAALTLPGRIVDFGYTTLSETSELTAVTLTNDGTAALKVRSVSRVGDHTESFSVSNSCGREVPPGQHCTLSLRAEPKLEGAQAAEIEIVSNAAGSPHLLSVKTFALSMEVLSADGQKALSALSLPDVSLNLPYPEALTFIVSNVAERAQTALLRYQANGLLEFKLADNAATGCIWRESETALVVPAGGRCIVKATAYRTTKEPWSGELLASLGGFDKALPITGLVLEAAPELLPGSALDWGPIAKGVRAEGYHRKIILANRGPGDLALSAVNLTDAKGAPSSDFLLVDSTCNSGVVRAGSACAVIVTPVLQETGPRTAVLTLVTSAGPYRVALAAFGGEAQAIWVTPAGTPVSELNWAVAEDAMDKSSTVLLRNTGEVDIARLEPAADSDFRLAVDPRCKEALAAGDQCVVTISPNRELLAGRAELKGAIAIRYGEGAGQELVLPVSVLIQPSSTPQRKPE